METTLNNEIPLDQALVDEFKSFQKNIRDNTIAMAEKAFEIRSQYLSADGRNYDPEFHTWWRSYRLDSIFGKLPNFTKWASAGAALAQAKPHEVPGFQVMTSIFTLVCTRLGCCDCS